LQVKLLSEKNCCPREKMLIEWLSMFFLTGRNRVKVLIFTEKDLTLWGSLFTEGLTAVTLRTQRKDKGFVCMLGQGGMVVWIFYIWYYLFMVFYWMK